MSLLIPTYMANARARANGTPLPTGGQSEASKIWARLGEIPKFDRLVFGNRVLVAKYMPDNIQGSSLVHSELTGRENEYQGKVGLVLRKGHLAFRSDSENDFGPDSVEVGDWVYFDFSAGTNTDLMEIGKIGASAQIKCKILRDVDILGVLPGPEYIY